MQSAATLTTPRYAVRHRGGISTEHPTLLGAMKAALTLVEAGHHGVAVVDRRASVTWRASLAAHEGGAIHGKANGSSGSRRR